MARQGGQIGGEDESTEHVHVHVTERKRVDEKLETKKTLQTRESEWYLNILTYFQLRLCWNGNGHAEVDYPG